MGSVRWIITLLVTFTMSCADAPSGIIPWYTGEVQLQDLAFIKICGVPSRSSLRHPVQSYSTVLEADTGEHTGPTYRGRWLEELFGKNKFWDSDETLVAATQAWLLRIGLTAAVVYHSNLLRGPLPVLPTNIPDSPVGSVGDPNAATLGASTSLTATHNHVDNSYLSEPNSTTSSYFLSRIGESPPVVGDGFLLPKRGASVVSNGPEGAVLHQGLNLTPTAAEAVLRQQQLSDLGVSEGDVDIIKYAERVMRDAAILAPRPDATSSANPAAGGEPDPAPYLTTSLAYPMASPATSHTQSENEPQAFPMIRLDTRKPPKE